ncbi:hypothetical protein TB1_006765 [Malus domestica]
MVHMRHHLLPTAMPQIAVVLDKMGEILKANGANYSSVVKTTILLADLKDLRRPLKSMQTVAALPLDAKIDIECIAAV